MILSGLINLNFDPELIFQAVQIQRLRPENEHWDVAIVSPIIIILAE